MWSALQRVEQIRVALWGAPWLVAAAPSLLYSLVSLGAFGWLVLRR